MSYASSRRRRLKRKPSSANSYGAKYRPFTGRSAGNGRRVGFSPQRRFRALPHPTPLRGATLPVTGRENRAQPSPDSPYPAPSSNRIAAARASSVIAAPDSIRAISSRRSAAASTATLVATRFSLPLADAPLLIRK
jgi:hypothetical protein